MRTEKGLAGFKPRSWLVISECGFARPKISLQPKASFSIYRDVNLSNSSTEKRADF
jgi:hypothetical protein